jgi:hypothetical protein
VRKRHPQLGGVMEISHSRSQLTNISDRMRDWLPSRPCSVAVQPAMNKRQ